MGLDITAYGIGQTARHGQPINQPLHYWRKHHALVDWLDRHTGAGAWEGVTSYTLTAADIDALAVAVAHGLPAAHYDGDAAPYYDDDLAFIRKAKAALAVGLRIEIVASC